MRSRVARSTPQAPLDGARENSKNLGLRIVYDRTYPPNAVDFAPIIRSIQATNPDVVYAASYPPDCLWSPSRMLDKPVKSKRRRLRLQSATIGGEGVICNDRGVTDFEALRTALAHHEAPEVFLFAFDLLELDGWDIRREPWETTRKTLGSLLRRAGEGIRLSEHLESSCGQAIFRHACSMGLEGIVSKRRDAPYRSGRCTDWIKVKNPNAPAATRIFE
jgi:hypothetical protein